VCDHGFSVSFVPGHLCDTELKLCWGCHTVTSVSVICDVLQRTGRSPPCRLKCCLLRRWIHYAWRHWEQLKVVPGISWQRISRIHTMMSIDQELTCKVLLPSFTCWHEIVI
jgi:hypothetical protein